MILLCFLKLLFFQIFLTKYPQPSGLRPFKRQFDSAALPLAMMFVVLYLFLIILPSIETIGFDVHLENTTRFSYLNGVVVYVINLLQIILIVFVIFVLFLVYNLFDCTSISFPFIFTFLFITAMMSFTFLLRAAIESSESVLKVQQVFKLP
jgi:uncharacterized membrane protein (DUF485 family)